MFIELKGLESYNLEPSESKPNPWIFPLSKKVLRESRNSEEAQRNGEKSGSSSFSSISKQTTLNHQKLPLRLLSSFPFLCYHFCQFGTRPHNQCAKLNFNHANVTAAQKRWASRATTTKDDNKISIGPRRRKEAGEDEKESGVVYYGPISSTIMKVKLLSLSTCCLSVSLGPVVTFMTSQDTNVILKGTVASSVIFFSASTTAALHWFVSPYIHKLRWQPGSDSFEVEMMSWLATFIPKTIKFADIRLPETNRPFVTFKANGNFYYVDSEHCHNKALLNRLTPQKSAHESAFKNL
ncbi:hypothetical protein SADUNF_Sadunf10G0169800 [Salix dunnii]|uniref:Uncharacterized protein n=1 Tax=Salix dunnii TaxID=1413687 RepID=A0A835JP81_9ROSI|nr:hypothetical protein SADUNF_Sadunf10G0169800 [Salix dunnii]